MLATENYYCSNTQGITAVDLHKEFQMQLSQDTGVIMDQVEMIANQLEGNISSNYLQQDRCYFTELDTIILRQVVADKTVVGCWEFVSFISISLTQVDSYNLNVDCLTILSRLEFQSPFLGQGTKVLKQQYFINTEAVADFGRLWVLVVGVSSTSFFVCFFDKLLLLFPLFNVIL